MDYFVTRRIRIPIRCGGGLAANVYGGVRALNDIDIDIPGVALSQVAERARGYVTFGPSRYHDDEFDIELLTLRYADQDIDLTAAESISLFDKRAGSWHAVPTALDRCESPGCMGNPFR